VPKVLIFYHFLHPDDVVSAVLFTDLAVELAQRGWDVTAMPSNRSCWHSSTKYPAREVLKGVQIRRVWRPGFPQHTTLGRFCNAAWMALRWGLKAIAEKPDLVILGTDPVLSVTAASIWKILRPKTKVAHWCFDLYPEAAIADGILSRDSRFLALLKPILAHAYRSCDLLADLGPCMSKRLRVYGSQARQATVTPWALAEPGHPVPVDRAERASIFGSAPLALLYAGNFGRAHSSDVLLELARKLEPAGAKVVFSVRGNKADALRRDAASISNVTFAPFTDQEHLEKRLCSADIHVVSLRSDWTGMVVPSKFFGALAVGRPVLFAGSPDAAIAHWIREHKVGWVLTPDTLEAVAAELIEYCQEPERHEQMFRHCYAVYQTHFSKKLMVDQWDGELRALLGSARTVAAEREKLALTR